MENRFPRGVFVPPTRPTRAWLSSARLRESTRPGAPPIHLPTYLHTYLSIYLRALLDCLTIPARLPAQYLPTSLPACLRLRRRLHRGIRDRERLRHFSRRGYKRVCLGAGMQRRTTSMCCLDSNITALRADFLCNRLIFNFFLLFQIRLKIWLIKNIYSNRDRIWHFSHNCSSFLNKYLRNASHFLRRFFSTRLTFIKEVKIFESGIILYSLRFYDAWWRQKWNVLKLH